MGVIKKEILLEGSRGGRAKVKVLFDSGASMSFIKRSLAGALANIEKLPRPLEFERSGETLVVYEVARLEFYLDG